MDDRVLMAMEGIVQMDGFEFENIDRDIRVPHIRDEFDEIPLAIQHFFVDQNQDQARRRDARERRDRERNARLADRNRDDEQILRRERDLHLIQRELRGEIAEGRLFGHRARQHRRLRRREYFRDSYEPGDARPRVIGTCDMCQISPQMQHFMKHFHECPKRHLASKKQKSLILHKYASSDYVLLRRLKKLRFDLEKNYYQALLDESELANMDCSKCETFEDHMNGACMENNQSAVFEVKSAEIRSNIMAHFEQYLHLKKDLGLEGISQKHNEHFNSIGECFEEVPDDLGAQGRRSVLWFDFRRNTIDEQNVERRNYCRTMEARNRTSFEMKLREVDDVIQSMSARMSTTISNNKSVTEEVCIRDMVRDARRQVFLVLSTEERREVNNRRRENRRAQREMAEEVGLAPVPPIRPVQFNGPAQDHEIISAELRDVMLQFDDSDVEEDPRDAN